VGGRGATAWLPFVDCALRPCVQARLAAAAAGEGSRHTTDLANHVDDIMAGMGPVVVGDDDNV
jgi:hypothetical protein